MPGTPPGCRLMAGRDRRSNMETVSRSLRLATQCPPSVAMTWCTTGLKAWLSVCTGTCARGRSGWRTSRTRQTQKTESADALTGLHWSHAVDLRVNEVALQTFSGQKHCTVKARARVSTARLVSRSPMNSTYNEHTVYTVFYTRVTHARSISLHSSSYTI